MEERPTVVLLVGNGATEIGRIGENLRHASVPFDCRHQRSFHDALGLLMTENVDVAVVEIGLLHSDGLDMVTRVVSTSPETSVIVLVGPDDEDIALESLQRGAQDYLIKGQDCLTTRLENTIRKARVRQHRYATLQHLSLVDELTGLYNRHGFMTLTEQQFKISERTQLGLVLALADVDGLKMINDTFGHQEGDRALVAVADVLRTTFRRSDILGRFGGDEFIALAIAAAQESGQIIMQRLTRQLENRNAADPRPYRLSCSLGVALFEPSMKISLDELIEKADSALYEHKRQRPVA